MMRWISKLLKRRTKKEVDRRRLMDIAGTVMYYDCSDVAIDLWEGVPDGKCGDKCSDRREGCDGMGRRKRLERHAVGGSNSGQGMPG